MTVQDEARLRRGHNDQSRLGHQCNETKEMKLNEIIYSPLTKQIDTISTRDNAKRRIPVSHKYPRVPYDGKQMGGPLDQ